MKLPEIDADLQYANWLKQTSLMISPKSQYLVLGRASGKTTDFIAERSQDIIRDMPGAFFAWAADTYRNAQKNIIPKLVEGWERLGWKEDIHFVVDKRPPAHFKRPYKRVIDWKHTVTTWNGCHFKLISMDQPSSGAGDDYQHIFGDEAKYLVKHKIDKLFPAARGRYDLFGNSVFYKGHTFATDMPMITGNEDDWILGMAKRMDPEQIKLILSAARVLNEIRIEKYTEEKQGINNPITNQQLEEWEELWVKSRKESTFYYVASSFINVDQLRFGYYPEQLESLGWEDFKSSVLGIKSTIRQGDAFYPKLNPGHFYTDGNNSLYDKFGLKDVFTETCEGLRYHDPDKPLFGGFDVGAYLWLVLGQPQGEEERILKNHFTVPDDYTRQLANQFIEFWAPHNKKVLYLYHDRSANNLKSVKQDVASKFKREIEYDEDGNPTGWYVKLMSEGQGVITQDDEYKFMMELLEERNPKLPKLRIDHYNCRELKSSLENAPVKMANRRGKKVIEKVKTSEQRYKNQPKLMPFMSTNFSDALKYYLMRKDYVQRSRSSRKLSFSDPKVRG